MLGTADHSAHARCRHLIRHPCAVADSVHVQRLRDESSDPVVVRAQQTGACLITRDQSAGRRGMGQHRPVGQLHPIAAALRS